jgi:hypothetical protein
MWWNSDDGRLYIYYTDADSSQWVDASPDSVIEEFWSRTGTTIIPKTAGDDVQLNSLNGGQLAGFRNILINGTLGINQRGVDISAAPVGTYGQDRWKRTAGGMTQIIQEGLYQPGETYTLSGNGVTTQQIVAPASGTWQIPDLPVTARNIQLEIGTVATPFEYRNSVDILLAQQYYMKDPSWTFGYSSYGSPPNPAGYALYYPRMRAIPSVNITFSGGVNVASVTVSSIGNQYISIQATPSAAGFVYFVSSGIELDAEL